MRNILIGLAVLCAGCTASQQAAIDAAISKNATSIQAFCTSKVIPIATSPLTQAALAALDLLPYGGDLSTAVASTVATCNAVDTVAQSATTLPYLEQEVAFIASGGKVAPPPAIAPAPVTAATVIPSVAVSP